MKAIYIKLQGQFDCNKDLFWICSRSDLRLKSLLLNNGGRGSLILSILEPFGHPKLTEETWSLIHKDETIQTDG